MKANISPFSFVSVLGVGRSGDFFCVDQFTHFKIGTRFK